MSDLQTNYDLKNVCCSFLMTLFFYKNWLANFHRFACYMVCVCQCCHGPYSTHSEAHVLTFVVIENKHTTCLQAVLEDRPG